MCAKFRRINLSLIKARIKTKEFEQLDQAEKLISPEKSHAHTHIRETVGYYFGIS